MIEQAIKHIQKTAKVPSFSTYEERLHPYVRSVFDDIAAAEEHDAPGNNLIFSLGSDPDQTTTALAAHLDKINHYGEDYPNELPVSVSDGQIEGAMDDCAGLGMMLSVAEAWKPNNGPNLLFLFSEMEESKGLKEHPELLRNNGEGYQHGQGARAIAEFCTDNNIMPEEVITLDTTPLFKGEQGIALYSKHWELNNLEPSPELIQETEKTVGRFITADPKIKITNNTNDYLQYGEVFNQLSDEPVVSVALEPAIYPYHQKGEKVFVDDIERALDILASFISL